MSIPLLATNTTQICRVVKALYDAAPGYTYLQNFLQFATANGVNGTANALASNFSSQTNAQLAATVCTNLGLTGTAYTAGVDYLTAQFNANTAANRGVVIVTAMNALANLTGDATFGSAASAFNASIARAEAYSTNENNTTTDFATLQASDDVSATTNFSLTSTTGETISGTAGADVFTGTTTDTGATFNTGDIVNGGLGNDKLIINAQGNSNTSVAAALNSVEEVSIRMLSSQTFDTLQWSGTTSVYINSDSLTNQTLNLDNAASGLSVGLQAWGTIDIDYLSAGTGDTARLFASGTYYQTPSNISQIDAGSADLVTLSLGGSNVLRLEGSHTNVTVTGGGSGVLYVDGISGLTATGFTGNLDVTFSAASNVAVVGGAGNDTFRFGSTFNGLDSVDGGSGTDSLRASIAGSVSLSGVRNVESATLNATGNSVTMSMSGASFSTISFAQGTAGVDLTLRDNIATNTTLQFSAPTGMGDIALDYALGATGTILFNGVSGDATYSGFSITDAAVMSVSVAGGSGDAAFSSFAVDADMSNLSIVSNGSGTFNVTSAGVLNVSGSETVSITVGGSGNFIGNGSAVMSGVTTLNLTNSGNDNSLLRIASADSEIQLGTGSHTVNIAATGSGGIEAFSFLVGRGTGDADGTFTLNVNLANDAWFGSATRTSIKGGSAGTIDLNFVNLGASGGAYFSAIDAGTSGRITDLVATVGSTGILSFADVDARTMGDINVAIGTGGGFVLTSGDFSGVIEDVTLSGAGSAAVSLTASGMGDLLVTTGQSSTVSLTAGSAGVGNVTLTGSGGTVTISTNASVGTVSIQGSGTYVLDLTSATTIGTVSTEGHKGAATIDLSSATNPVSVTLAASGVDTVRVGAGDDVVYFDTVTSQDVVVFSRSSTDAASIYNFSLASATDVIRFATAGFTIGLATATSIDEGGSLNVVLTSAAATTSSTTTVNLASAAEPTELVILRSGSYTDVRDMLSAISSAGTRVLTAAGSAKASPGSDLIIAWADSNGDTNITLVNMTAVAGGGVALFSSVTAAQAANTNTLATLYGVNIATFSGSSFTDKFQFGS